MKNSVRAISWLVKNESAFRQELILLILAAGVLAFWSIPYMEKTILLSSILFVLFAEIINTAIEVNKTGHLLITVYKGRNYMGIEHDTGDVSWEEIDHALYMHLSDHVDAREHSN